MSLKHRLVGRGAPLGGFSEMGWKDGRRATFTQPGSGGEPPLCDAGVGDGGLGSGG